MHCTRALALALALPAAAHAQFDVQGCDQSPSPAEVAAYLEMISGGASDSATAALLTPTDYWIPVRWHIVRTDAGTGGFSPNFIDDAMADLEAAFATGETWGDFGHLHFFEAAPVEYIDSDALYLVDDFVELEQLKAINPTVNAVDIYVVNSFPGSLGIPGVTQLGGISSFTVSQAAGIAPGIVVARTHLPPVNPQWNKILLAHEMGHYFDLFHVHETAFGLECTGINCGDPGGGDLVCDTVATPLLAGWNTNLTTCQYTGGGSDPCAQAYGQFPMPTDNYMNVLNMATCINRFTREQNGKAIKTLVFTRNDTNPLFTPNPPLPPTGTLPIITSYPGSDCNGTGIPDAIEIGNGTAADCNQNWIPDSCEIDLGWEQDYDGDGVLDSCETICQTDLGFQGPGNVTLSICGLDLTGANSIADVLVTGGVPDGLVWLLAGFTNDPVPLGLGTLVPNPLFGEPVPVLADENGTVAFPLAGAGGPPFTFYLQAVVVNAGVKELSNALEVVAGT